MKTQIVYRCTANNFLAHDVVEGEKLKCPACSKKLQIDVKKVAFKKPQDHVLLTLGEVGISE